MGCSLFANDCFQMGVTVMGFAEHFGLCLFVNLIFATFYNHTIFIFQEEEIRKLQLNELNGTPGQK